MVPTQAVLEPWKRWEPLVLEPQRPEGRPMVHEQHDCVQSLPVVCVRYPVYNGEERLSYG